MLNTKAKVQRALYGPSLTEVTVGAVLSVALGALLGAIFLILKPVQKVSAVPEQPQLGAVYYVEGSHNSGRGRQYLRKRQLFLEGSPESITVTEDELNTWIASSRANPDSRGSGLLAPTGINFRVSEGVFQVGLPSTLNVFASDRSVILQARGAFDTRNARVAFVPQQVFVGSLAAHRIPGLAPLMINRMLASQNIPAELTEAWQRLSQVDVQDDHLVLSF